MRNPALRLHLGDDEQIIDGFAGGGGASTGIEIATGRSPDVAVNHDADALAMHAANHPKTRHLRSDVWEVDPVEVCGGKPVGLAWFSPDCTFFSKARGAKPFRDRRRATRRRSLAHVVVRWANAVHPRVICMENVEEFEDWGPLTPEGLPDRARAGLSFRRWKRQLERAGYEVQLRQLRACDYGAPTSRKRLFVVARCDGAPIVWPAPTHGKTDGGLFPLKPYRTAAECIDWSIPCPSIFERKKPLAEKTLRRIARGIQRYVLDAADPFIVPITHNGDRRAHPLSEPFPTVTGAHRGEHAIVAPFLKRDFGTSVGSRADAPALTTTCDGGGHQSLITPVLTECANASNPRSWRTDEPLRTQCANVKGGHFAVAAPVLVRHYGGERGNGAGRAARLDQPTGTVTCCDHHALVSATLINTRNGERDGQAPRVLDIQAPAPTVTAQGSQGALVSAFLAKHFGGHEATGSSMGEPVHTVTARDHHGLVTAQLAPGAQNHAEEVRALLVKFYGNERDGHSIKTPLGTVTTKDRFGLVTVTIRGVPYVIVDIGMRMLQPRELFNAQGFPAGYVIDRGADGVALTKTAQVRMCGNSVCPPIAAALVGAQLAEPARARGAA